MRVLEAVRLSRDTDASTSTVRQREVVQGWAQMQSARVVHIAEDVNVSGAQDPFKRPGLGPWLTEHIDEWDVLVAWKLDRISRSSLDMLRLVEHCKANRKRIVGVSDSIDTGSSMGEFMLEIAAAFAKMERTTIAERAAASRAKLYQEGRWAGESVAYGYCPEPLPTGGFHIVQDPGAAEVIRDAVSRCLAGQSINSIAEALTAEGVPTPRDRARALVGKPGRSGKWNQSTLQKILTSDALIGRSQNSAADDPVLTMEQFEALRGEIDSRRRGKTANPRSNASPLLGVLTCGKCGHVLHHQARTDPRYRYYHCPNRCGKMLTAADMETLAEETFLAELGTAPVMTRVKVAGFDPRAEMAELALQFRDLNNRIPQAGSAAAKAVLTEKADEVDQRMAELETLPATEPTERWTATAVTYGEEWAQRDTDGRRALLLDSGIRIEALRTEASGLSFRLIVPEDVAQRVGGVPIP